MKKLSKWAKEYGISYQTAWRWVKEGRMPCGFIKTPSGTILVEETASVRSAAQRPTYIYARVSSPSKKEDMHRQAQRCEDFCAANGWSVTDVVKEVASGMNDGRRRLTKLLEKPPGRLVVEHKDRLTRFGFNYFEILLPKLGWELVVVNRDVEEVSDLTKDLVAVVTSFCCRLYGLRRGTAKAKAVRQLCKPDA